MLKTTVVERSKPARMVGGNDCPISHLHVAERTWDIQRPDAFCIFSALSAQPDCGIENTDPGTTEIELTIRRFEKDETN